MDTFMGAFYGYFLREIFMDVLGKIRYFVTHKKKQAIEVVYLLI